MFVNSKILLIAGMMLVTYIPRLVPFLVISDKNLSKRVNGFLRSVPYVALGALIIPGVFSAIPKMPEASLLGIAFAFIYGWFRGGIIIPVLGSIFITVIMLSMKYGLVF